MQAVNHTVEVERLYDELRECLQANDQAGAQRIFAELVRAKRPLAEIVGEVKRLSRGSTRSELDPEPSTTSEHSITEEWRQPDIPPQSATAAPEPAPALTYASVPSTSTPAAGPSNPAETAVYREPARDTGAPREWSQGNVAPDTSLSRAGPGPQSFDGTAAFDLRSHSNISPIPAISNPEPVKNSWSEERAEPAAPSEPEQSTPAPSPQQFAQAIEPETAAQVMRAAIAGTEQAVVASDPMPLQNAVTEPVEDPADIAPQISGRAIALGVRSDSANDGDSVQSGRTSRYSVAHLGAALAVLLVLAAGGAFLMLKPARDTAGDNAIASAAATANDPKAAPAAPSANAGQRPSGLAATPLLPAPAASRPPPAVLPSVPAPSPQATAAAPATAKPDPKPAVVSIEPPKITAAPEKPAPVAAPAAAPAPVPAIETPPAPPRSSSLETAPLLERGDGLFAVGDVTSARLFYERAADAGNGEAALRLGETYDPVFLERAKLRAIQGDLKAAVFWYRRAKELGIAEAEILLKGIQTK